MIIKALVDQYEIWAKEKKVPLKGWSICKVTYALAIDKNGKILELANLTTEEGKRKIPRLLTVPEQPKRSSGIKPFFLADNATYFLGIDPKENLKKAQERFQKSKELHHEILKGLDDPAATAVLRFFENWSPGNAEKSEIIARNLEGLKKGSNLVFFFDGKFVHEYPAIRQKWMNYLESSAAEPKAICSITGNYTQIARLHPLIKGLRGAQPAGASLVSFNDNAYLSHGKEQGMNAPIGKEAAFKYGAALNYLLENPDMHQNINGTTYVFWAAHPKSQMFSRLMIQALLSETIDQPMLNSAFNAIRQGKPINIEENELAPDTSFYILGLSPNAARISVRFFSHNKFGFYAQNLAAHQERLKIIRQKDDKKELLGIDDLLKEITNEKTREKKAADVIAGEVLRAVLLNTQYPQTLIANLAIRIRAEQKITRGKAAIIKAFYQKNKNSECPEEVLTVSLNTETKNTPYLLGRAFAILEIIQESSNKSIKSTIRDRYFSSSSATPSYIFPILINLSQNHLKKIKSSQAGLGIALELKLGEILAEVGTVFPTRLTLPQQGAFQLGYYHQREDWYSSSKEKNIEKKENN